MTLELPVSRKLDLSSEVRWDESIAACGPLPSGAPINVALTGATGYLGTFLLHELLVNTSADAYCIVRADDERHAQGRIRASMTHHGVWQDEFASRIVPVVGDVGRPNLSLPERVFSELAERCDTVIHGAANVNFLFPYRALRAANVSATVDALRLACTRTQKRFHFVSTIGLFLSADHAGEHVLEGDGLERVPLRANGYSQSKWVAERVLMLARERGVPVTVHRPGFIGWHGRTGAFNDKDFVSGLLRACLALGKAPDVDLVLDVAPVDYVVSAMRWLITQVDFGSRTYHLNSPHPSRFKDVVDLCRAGGADLEWTPYESFRRELVLLRDPTIHRFATMLPEQVDEEGSIFAALESPPTFGFEEVQRDLAGSGLDCHGITRATMAAFIGNAASPLAPPRAESSTRLVRPRPTTATG